MIDYDNLKAWHFPVLEGKLTRKESMLYGLSVGMGSDPTNVDELKFVSEGLPGGLVTMPTIAVVLGHSSQWITEPGTGIDVSKTVHVEEELRLFAPIDCEADFRSTCKVVSLVDKGPGKAAVLTWQKDLFARDTGIHLASMLHTVLCREQGGFAPNEPNIAAEGAARSTFPDNPATVVEIHTVPQQQLLYSLCAGPSRAHTIPSLAPGQRHVKRPSLQGLCTFGLAARAVLSAYCALDPGRLKLLSCRFTGPVYPGETLRFEMFRDGDEVIFRAATPDGARDVLGGGRALLCGQ